MIFFYQNNQIIKKIKVQTISEEEKQKIETWFKGTGCYIVW